MHVYLGPAMYASELQPSTHSSQQSKHRPPLEISVERLEHALRVKASRYYETMPTEMGLPGAAVSVMINLSF